MNTTDTEGGTCPKCGTWKGGSYGVNGNGEQSKHTCSTDTEWESRYEEKFGSLRFRGNPKEAIKDFIRREIQQKGEEEYERGRKDAVRDLMRGPAHEEGSSKAYKQIDLETLEAALEKQP